MGHHDDRVDLRPRMGKSPRARDRVGSSSLRVATLVRRGHGWGFGAKASMRIPVAPEGFAPRHNARRVIVKAHVQRLTRHGAQAACRHLRYIEREGVEKDGSPGLLYGPEGPVSREQFEQPRLDERHQFRFIVSPEDGNHLDLTEYVRRLMARVDRDLGRSVEWAAVNHHDTDHPHAHVVVRGVDLEGRQLRLLPAYIARGFRWSAQDLATEILGPRLDVEIRRTFEREVSQERFTSLDRELERAASGQRVDTELLLPRRGGPEPAQLVRRLEQLQNLGLAGPASGRVWVLTEGWQFQLRHLGERGDILKQIHRSIDGGDPSRFHVVRRGQGLPDGHGGVEERVLVGRVVRKGLADEQRGTFYAVLETPTGEVYHVPIGARAVDALCIRQLVSFRTQREPAVHPAEQSAKQHGEAPTRYRLTIEPLPLWLDAQVNNEGPVWLDTVAEQSLAKHGFGVEVRRAVVRRRQALLELGVAPDDPQRDTKLRDFKRRAVGESFARQTGQKFLETIPSGFRGSVQPGTEGAHYLVVSDGTRFVLVAATRETRAFYGQTVDVSRDAKGQFLGFRSRDLDRGR